MYFDCYSIEVHKGKGTKCPSNELIRVIDGASFYELVTGKTDALYELFQVLPDIIEKVFKEKFNKIISIKDKQEFNDFFNKAYIIKK